MSVLLGMAACGVTTEEVEPEKEATVTAETKVKSALIDAPDIDAAAIEVSIKNRVLRLDGFVSSEEEARRAEALAREQVPGRKVESTLEVK